MISWLTIKPPDEWNIMLAGFKVNNKTIRVIDWMLCQLNSQLTAKLSD